MIEFSKNNHSFVEKIQNQEGIKKPTFICHICEEKFEHYAFEAHFPICAKKCEKYLKIHLKSVHMPLNHGIIKLKVSKNQDIINDDSISSFHSSKFFKRNYILPLHSQKLVTYFGQISPDLAFLFIRGVRIGRTGLVNN